MEVNIFEYTSPMNDMGVGNLNTNAGGFAHDFDLF